jgi:hypothetical protein
MISPFGPDHEPWIHGELPRGIPLVDGSPAPISARRPLCGQRELLPLSFSNQTPLRKTIAPSPAFPLEVVQDEMAVPKDSEGPARARIGPPLLPSRHPRSQPGPPQPQTVLMSQSQDPLPHAINRPSQTTNPYGTRQKSPVPMPDADP